MGAGERGHSCPRRSQGHPWEDRHPLCPHGLHPGRGKVRDNLQGRRDTGARGHLEEDPHSLAQPCFLSSCCVQALLHRPGTERSQAGWPCLSGGVFPRRGSFPDITSEPRPSGKRTARVEAGCAERERWRWRDPRRGGGRLASEVVWRAASTWRDRKPGTALDKPRPGSQTLQFHQGLRHSKRARRSDSSSAKRR